MSSAPSRVSGVRIRGQAALTRSARRRVGRLGMSAARAHGNRGALALVLLTGAGLMMRTIREITRVETRVQRTISSPCDLADRRTWTEPRRCASTPTCSAVRSAAGVSNAALAFSLPIEGSNWNSFFIARDKPIRPGPSCPARHLPPSARATSNDEHETGRRPLSMRATTPTARTSPSSTRRWRALWPERTRSASRSNKGWPNHRHLGEMRRCRRGREVRRVTVETPLQVYLR